MVQNTLKARLVQKHDIEAHWLLAKNFVPMRGEFIVYDTEIDSDGSILKLPEGRTEPYTYARYKIGDGVTSINDLPFAGDRINDEVGAIFTNGSIGLKYAIYDEHAEFIGLGECTDTIVEIASIVQGRYVTAINDNALESRNKVTEVVIPKRISSIGNYAFYSCDSLTSVVIPDSVTSIGNYAFYSCRSLTSVVIPDSVTSIGDYAFSWCDSPTNLVIPNGVTSIGDNAFAYCSSLTSVTIGNGVTSISKSAFEGCTSLTNLVIPNGVTSIGDDAFHYCYNLTSVVIPDSVTSIGGEAFSECDSLTDIYYTGTEEDWNAIIIGSNNESLTNTTIHYNWEG